MKKINIFAIFFIVPFLLDRITKYIALCSNFSSFEYNKIFSFDLSLNRGISWSIFDSGDEVTFYVLTSVILVITAALAWYTYTRLRLGFSVYGELLIFAGALSNLVDRLLYKGVIDFIVVDLGFYVWPTFNIADVAIVLGVCIILYKSFYEEKITA